MPTAHDYRDHYREHHSQAARLMVEAQQLESECQSIRLLASDIESSAHGVLSSGRPCPELIEARECTRRACGELQAAREMLAERRAQLWEEKAVRARRMVAPRKTFEGLTTGGR